MGNCAAIAEISRLAASRAENYRETLADVDPSRSLTLRAIAAELNRREIEAPRGGIWHPGTVAYVRGRLENGGRMSAYP